MDLVRIQQISERVAEDQLRFGSRQELFMHYDEKLRQNPKRNGYIRADGSYITEKNINDEYAPKTEADQIYEEAHLVLRYAVKGTLHDLCKYLNLAPLDDSQLPHIIPVDGELVARMLDSHRSNGDATGMSQAVSYGNYPHFVPPDPYLYCVPSGPAILMPLHAVTPDALIEESVHFLHWFYEQGYKGGELLSNQEFRAHKTFSPDITELSATPWSGQVAGIVENVLPSGIVSAKQIRPTGRQQEEEHEFAILVKSIFHEAVAFCIRRYLDHGSKDVLEITKAAVMANDFPGLEPSDIESLLLHSETHGIETVIERLLVLTNKKSVEDLVYRLFRGEVGSSLGHLFGYHLGARIHDNWPGEKPPELFLQTVFSPEGESIEKIRILQSLAEKPSALVAHPDTTLAKVLSDGLPPVFSRKEITHPALRQLLHIQRLHEKYLMEFTSTPNADVHYIDFFIGNVWSERTDFLRQYVAARAEVATNPDLQAKDQLRTVAQKYLKDQQIKRELLHTLYGDRLERVEDIVRPQWGTGEKLLDLYRYGEDLLQYCRLSRTLSKEIDLKKIEHTAGEALSLAMQTINETLRDHQPSQEAYDKTQSDRAVEWVNSLSPDKKFFQADRKLFGGQLWEAKKNAVGELVKSAFDRLSERFLNELRSLENYFWTIDQWQTMESYMQAVLTKDDIAQMKSKLQTALVQITKSNSHAEKLLGEYRENIQLYADETQSVIEQAIMGAWKEIN